MQPAQRIAGPPSASMRMRIGVRAALIALAIGGIGLSGLFVHVAWKRAATQSGHSLAAELNRHIADSVKKELAQTIASAQGAWNAIRTIFLQNVIETREADKREFIFLSQLQAQPAISWIVFGWPDDSVFAARKLGDEALEMTEIGREGGQWNRRLDRYRIVPGDIEFERRAFVPTDLEATAESWYAAGVKNDLPVWLELGTPLDRERPAIAYAGPIEVYQKRVGVLAVLIELSRLSRFLASLDIAGGKGAVFILGPDGMPIAAPDAAADETTPVRMHDHPLIGLARRTLLADRATTTGPRRTATFRVAEHDIAYQVTTTPLRFLGWEVVTVIPETHFLGALYATTRRLTFLIGVLLLIAGAGAAFVARRLFADPIRAIAGDLARIESFDVERIVPARSYITEIDRLGAATARMALGLASFRKFLPADLVRMLVADGVEPRPGGAMRPVTVLFADLAGFTGLSERLGAGVVPLVSSYLDIAAGAVLRERGTVDKFIGDAIMAFWNAPRMHPEPALAACRAALGLVENMRARDLRDDRGDPLTVRIGINSGETVVGNIGSQDRLDYTALGDVVNIASRLEGLNKHHGTSILIGEETRRQAGDSIITRDIGNVSLPGRANPVRVYELLCLSTGGGDTGSRPDPIVGLAAVEA